MNIIDTLAERNDAFSRTRFSQQLRIVPSQRLLIVGCVDPRVDPAEVLGLQAGEAAVIRNVGGRVYPSTLETLDMLVEVAHAAGGGIGAGWNLVVLHHTDCGINSLARSPELLARHFGVNAAGLADKAITDPYASVLLDVAALKSEPRLAGATITGLVYDVHSGRTQIVETAARANA